MRLAYISAEGRGETDRLLSDVARYLLGEGTAVAGVVRVACAEENFPDCDTDLMVLPNGPEIRITQSLGKGAQGCRLDPAGIEAAVAAVEARAAGPIDLFILNKFGPQEAEGRGFRAAIGAAMERDIPVLVGVGLANRDAFKAFADGMAETLAPDAAAIRTWCREVLAEGASG